MPPIFNKIKKEHWKKQMSKEIIAPNFPHQMKKES